jgi:phosphoribosylformimino-5-aminoimidazole carboxamide ribotide isomerase
MRVIPVLDIRGGIAVHAVKGERAHYGPLSSVWHPGSVDPRALSEAYKRKYRLDTPLELYLADLDAIENRAPPDTDLYRDLHAKGIKLWLDAGTHRAVDCASWFESGVEIAVLGLETLSGPAELSEAVRLWGAQRLLFSLDLRNGTPVVDAQAAWGTNDPSLIAELAAELGIRRLLVLDLARVGTGSGPAGVAPIHRVSRIEDMQVFIGGGVRGMTDLSRLSAMGVAGAMVGTAVHEGRVEPHDLNGVLPEET